MGFRWLGRVDPRAFLPVGSTFFPVAPVWLNGQMVELIGGPEVLVKSVVHWRSQGQSLGRWSVMRRAEDAILAGRPISFRRMVPAVALARVLLVRVAEARVRLKAMVANTSQAALAVNLPEGKCARAEFFRSAWTCSMLCRRLHNIDYPDVVVMPMLTEKCWSGWPGS